MIHYLRLTNFRCFADVSITFPTTPGLCAVVGENKGSDYADANGVGKSTIYRGISWVLFGEFPGMNGTRSILRRGMPRGEAATGEALLDTKQGKLWIQRKRTRSKETVSFRLADVPSEQSWDEKVATEKIVEILGVSYKLFSQLLVFSGDFTFANLTDAPMKAILAAFCPIDVTAAQKTAAAAVAANAAKLAGARGTLASLTTQVQSIIKTRDDAAAHVLHWEAEHDQAVYRTEEDVLAGQRSLDLANADCTAADAARDSAKPPDISHLRASLASERTAYDALNQSYKSLVAEKDSLNATINHVQSHASNTTCSACGQALPTAAIAGAKSADAARIEQAKLRIAQVATELAAVVQKMTEISTRAQSIVTAINNNAQHEATYAALAAVATKRRDERNAVSNSLASARTLLASLKHEQNPYTFAVNQANTSIADLTRSIDVYTTDIRSFEQHDAALNYVSAMCGKKGLAHFALENVLPTLSTRAAIYLAALSPSEMSVSFRARTESGAEGFYVHADTKDGGEEYDDLSAGQQRRIDAAVFLANYDLAALTLWNPGVMFLDELLDHSMDMTGKMALLSLLSEYARRNNQVIFVVTNDRAVASERSMFQNVFCVQRSEGISTVSVT